jgi:gamma-glutamyltranspeptidase
MTGRWQQDIAADLMRAGSPVSADDLAAHKALTLKPLSVQLSTGTVWNMPPPTQGLSSLMILGLFDRLGMKDAEGFRPYPRAGRGHQAGLYHPQRPCPGPGGDGCRPG